MHSSDSTSNRPRSIRPLANVFFGIAFVIALACSVAFASPARAGVMSDQDADLVPDQFDTCTTFRNGPNETSNQVDTDLDGYGNRCDPDYDNDCAVTPGDFALFLAVFGGPSTQRDLDGDLSMTPADFAIFLSFFGGPPGPSGLACANCGSPTPIVCTP